MNAARKAAAWPLIRLGTWLLRSHGPRWVVLNTSRTPVREGPDTGKIKAFVTWKNGKAAELPWDMAFALKIHGVPVPAAVAHIAGYETEGPDG